VVVGVLVADVAVDGLFGEIFIDVAIIVVVARLMGALFKRLHQPAVVGEILAGIALGPSLLGLIPGSWFGLSTTIPEWLFPLEVRPYLKVLAELGLIIFMFIVGLELDVGLIRGRERIAATISVTSVALPFGLGLLLAGAIYGTYGVVNGKEVEFLPFGLFIGISMSITAFPVLARILTERGMHRTPVGALALASAAVDDILAWSLLALVLAVISSSGGSGGVTSLARILGESILFLIVMFVFVRPLLAKLVPWYERAGRLTPDILAIVIVGFLVCSYITFQIGIHDIFGAFVFGAIMPREGAGALTHDILEKLEQVSVLLLLPVFFIATGLNVNIKDLGWTGLVTLVLVLLVAVSGKFIGATLAARFSGISWSRAGAIGTLMNTRGLTELVVLNIGLAAGVLTNSLFTILVLMAIVTTVMTEPLLRIFYPDRKLRRDIAEAERAAMGVPNAYRVIVAVGDVEETTGVNLVDLGLALVGDERPAEIVLGRFQPQQQRLELGSGMAGELGSFADSLGALHTLSQRVEAVGIPCTVRSQYSLDPMDELLMLADAMFADVLIVAAGDDDGDDVWADARVVSNDVSCTVIAVRHPERPLAPDTGTVGVSLAGQSTDGVLEVAGRLAYARNAPVAIAGDSRAVRRARSGFDRLADRLVASADGGTDALAPAMVVVSDDAGNDDGTGPVLVVRGAPDAAERWQALLTRLSSGTAPEVPVEAPAEAPAEAATADPVDD
jgi:Kef-type K+ transport system membrane component KefB